MAIPSFVEPYRHAEAGVGRPICHSSVVQLHAPCGVWPTTVRSLCFELHRSRRSVETTEAFRISKVSHLAPLCTFANCFVFLRFRCLCALFLLHFFPLWCPYSTLAPHSFVHYVISFSCYLPFTGFWLAGTLWDLVLTHCTTPPGIRV